MDLSTSRLGFGQLGQLLNVFDRADGYGDVLIYFSAYEGFVIRLFGYTGAGLLPQRFPLAMAAKVLMFRRVSFGSPTSRAAFEGLRPKTDRGNRTGALLEGPRSEGGAKHEGAAHAAEADF
jgi:hypothetical protein